MSGMESRLDLVQPARLRQAKENGKILRRSVAPGLSATAALVAAMGGAGRAALGGPAWLQPPRGCRAPRPCRALAGGPAAAWPARVGTASCGSRAGQACRPRRAATAAAEDWAASLGKGLFGGDRVRLPSCAEEVVEDLKRSLDAILVKDLPRVEAELPPGFRFGFEGVKDELVLVEGGPAPERVAQGDRELAAFLLTAFDEPPDLCVAFRTGNLVSAAKRAWKHWGESHVFALPRSGTKRKPAFGGRRDASPEEGAAAVEELLKKKGCRNFVVVAPRAEQLRLLAALDDRLSADTRIILLNARVRGLARHDELRESFAASFNPVFHLRLAGPGGAGMVFRAARPGGEAAPWILARRNLPSLEPKEISRSKAEPSADEEQAAFKQTKH